jgi:transposase
VDVCSQSLEARIGPTGASASFPNNPSGIAALCAFCDTHQVELVAMEATGGYEQQAFAQLSEHGLAVSILNPRSVRQFAQSMGRLEKTDAIDAGMIGWYAEVKNSPSVCLAPQILAASACAGHAPSPVNRGAHCAAQSTAAGH